MTRRWTAALAAVVLFAAPAFAQTAPSAAPPPRTSPHETINATVGGSRVIVVYGRPYSKDPKNPATIRKIWGTLVPWDKVWRLGSDEATLLITQSPLVIGETTIPAGAYSLYLLPTENGPTKLLINKAIGQWGIGAGGVAYLPDIEKQELARFDMKKEDLTTSVDQLTIAVAADRTAGPNSGVLKVEWEKTRYSLPFTIKK